MNIHFIAIGGAIMHNLAIALKRQGHTITGSDDVIFDPSKSRLLNEGLLPKSIGFKESNISSKIDLVILGMHAKPNNIELLKAKDLGINIQSFPAFVNEQTKNKQRIVIAGSHGKTTTTAMTMHVLKEQNIDFDYLVGSSLEGFDLSVKLSNASIIILEGDEYLSSPIDLQPKFHYYKPNISVITGIAWDHVNVFPTWKSYVDAFKIYVEQIPNSSTLILYKGDEVLKSLAAFSKAKIIFYETPKYKVGKDASIIEHNSKKYVMHFFGKHNFENMEAAHQVCKLLDINDDTFYNSIQSFKGTAKRLEPVINNNNIVAFRDFAHSPSKLKATILSVKEQFPKKKLIAAMELHTYSSTDLSFLNEYKNTMNTASVAIVYMSTHSFKIKNKEAIPTSLIKNSFNNQNIIIIRTPKALENYLHQFSPKDVFLLMSSGSFDGINWQNYFNTFI